MRKSVEHVIAVDAAQANALTDKAKLLALTQRARILLMIADRGVKQGMHLPFGRASEDDRLHDLAIDTGDEFARAQKCDRVAPVFGGNAVGKAFAGAAFGKPEHKPRLLPCAAMDPGIDAQRTGIPFQKCWLARNEGKFRSPHQRAIGKDPKVDMIVAEKDFIRECGLLVQHGFVVASGQTRLKRSFQPMSKRLSMKSRFLVLLAAVLIVSVGWIFGWRHLSMASEEAFVGALAAANRDGVTVACANPRAHGFPFRLAIDCDNPSFSKDSDLTVRAEGMLAQAFVYRPMHQVVDFRSPAEIKAGRLGTLQLIWQTARFGSQLQANGLSAATAKIEKARLSFLNPPVELDGTAVTAEQVIVNARRTSPEEAADSVVFGVNSIDLAVEGPQFSLPPVSVGGLILAYGVAGALDGQGAPLPLWIEKGGEAEIQSLEIISGKAHMSAKGWVKLDLDGFIHADLDVDSANLQDFVEAMGPSLVQFQSVASAVIATIDGLGENVTLNGEPAKRVKFIIRKGIVKLGIIPLGVIPQIDVARL